MNAIILAAGLGTRLRPLTNDRPKAMVEVAGAPMLQHLIYKMKNAGFKHIVINVHYMAEQIIDFLQRNNSYAYYSVAELVYVHHSYCYSATTMNHLYLVRLPTNYTQQAQYHLHKQHCPLTSKAVWQT